MDMRGSCYQSHFVLSIVSFLSISLGLPLLPVVLLAPLRIFHPSSLSSIVPLSRFSGFSLFTFHLFV